MRALLYACHVCLYCCISSCDLLVKSEDVHTCFSQIDKDIKVCFAVVVSLAVRYCFHTDLVFEIGCVQRVRFERFGIMILARFCTRLDLDLIGNAGMLWLTSSCWLPCLFAGRTCTACLPAGPAWPACSAEPACLVCPACPACPA